MLNDMGINAGTHRGSCSHWWHSASNCGGESRSAVMCLRFIPCYKSGGGDKLKVRLAVTCSAPPLLISFANWRWRG